MLTWELLGSLVGAGFASGREIAVYFAVYGPWGYMGAGVAALTLVWLADTALPAAWALRWPERMWKLLLTALLSATGGAMMAGAGEIAALTLPLHGAYPLGMAATLMIAYILARCTVNGLARVSRGMLFVFAIMMIAGLTLPGEEAVIIASTQPMTALARGFCYGGFNAALLVPILQRRHHDKKKSLRRLCGIIILLLMMGTMVLQLHPSLMYEPMPFVQLMKRMGKLGYILSAACMYLAILSTLTACIRALGRSIPGFMALILISLLGFDQVIDQAYGLLGGACCLMLVAAKFMNCSGKAFISRWDVL